MNEHPERSEDDPVEEPAGPAATDDVDDLENDPAYNPQDEGLKDIKGG